GFALNGITVLKYRLQPGATLQLAPGMIAPGKMPPGLRKLAFVLANGFWPEYDKGRGSQKLFDVVPSKHPNAFGVHGNPELCVTIALICQPPSSMPLQPVL